MEAALSLLALTISEKFPDIDAVEKNVGSLSGHDVLRKYSGCLSGHDVFQKHSGHLSVWS